MPSVLLCLLLLRPQDDEIRRLVDLLGSESLAERESATEELIEIGEPARKHLKPLAEKSESELQERARFILNRLDAKARREALLKRGNVPPELLRRDPELVDRIASLNPSDRERAFEELTGIRMKAVREDPTSSCSGPRWHLPSLRRQALLAEFPELIREILRIGARDPRRAWSASGAVGQLQSPFMRRILLESLDDPDPGMRAFAAHACGSLGITDAATKLERLLKDEDRTVVTFAISSLGSLASRSSAPAIAGLLEHPDASVRECALRAVARLGYREAVPVIRKFLTQKPEDENRSVAAGCLLLFRDPADLDLWIELSKEDDWGLRMAAVEALDRIPGEKSSRALAAMLGDSDSNVLVSLTCALTRRGVRGVADGVEAAIDRIDEQYGQHPQLVYALRDLPDDDREARFRRLLGDRRSLVRRAALDVVGDLRLHGLVKDVMAMLRGEEGVYAAAALLRLEYSDSVALRKLFPTFDSANVHRLVARKIVRIETPERLLADPDPEIRRAALSESSEEAIQERIERMLVDEDAGVAAAAVRRARKSNLRAVAPKLVALLDVKTPASLFSESVRTLGEWGVREAIPRLIPFLPKDDLEGTVVASLGRLKAVEAESEILRRLDEFDVTVAGTLRLTKALGPLREMMVLFGGTERGKMAASAYVEIRCGEESAKVETMLEDEDEMVRIGAIRKSWERGSQKAVDRLRERLDDPSRDVALEAARLLVRWGDNSRRTLRFAKGHLNDSSILFHLNRLRNPQEYRALTTKELEPWIGGEFPVPDKAALYEDALGMEVRISPFAFHNSSTSMKDSTFETAEDLLWDVPVLLEKDRIVVMDSDEAERFWTEWIGRELKE